MRRWRPSAVPILPRGPQFGAPGHSTSRSFRLGIGAYSLVIAVLLAPSALAAEVSRGAGPSEVVFLTQIIVLLLVGRLMGEAMQRIGQPAVMGQLLAGLLLGPSVLGALWPEGQHALFPASREQKSMIDAVSQLGILMLLLLTGMETDLSLVRKARRAAFSVSVTGIVIPFVCGFMLGEFLPEGMLPRPDLRLITSLFLGTALSISSVKIVAMVVREMNFMRRDVGQVIVASAIIDDTIGWVIIAITFSLALHASLDLMSLGQSVLGTAVFLLVSFTIGRRLVFRLIRWTNDTFVSDTPVITTILVVMGVMALITHVIGVHTVLGAFVAGILVGESPILTRHIDEQLRGLIVALFMPVFFGMVGLSADLSILKNPDLLLLTLGLILIASVGKFVGAFTGGWFGGLSRAESLALACGMNARGSTEAIVASIGLSMGALSQELFTMIIAMAVVTTMVMPPMLRWALRRLPLREEEKTRLEREAFEARGFVTRLERLLLAVDKSAQGAFASRVAGLLAGSRGMPVTVLQLGSGSPQFPERESAISTVKTVAENIKKADLEETASREVEVTERSPMAPIEEAVASEARKGYDLLVIGVEPSVAPEGGFHPKVACMARSFEGPLAVAVARGAQVGDPLRTGLDILVPVTDTEVSRRGAEVALALAQASGTPVTALYVLSSSAGATAARKRHGGPRRAGEAILKEVVGLADQYGVPIRTALRVNMTAEDAILRQARIGKYCLIVMGVTRRSGPALVFGNVAEAVLEKCDRSLLFVAS